MEKSHDYRRKEKDVSLLELRDKLAEFAKVRGWEQYHSPRNLLLALGEVSEIFQWKCLRYSSGREKWKEDYRTGVVLIKNTWRKNCQMYLVQLADVCGLDLGQAALSKIVKNGQKYPLPS